MIALSPKSLILVGFLALVSAGCVSLTTDSVPVVDPWWRTGDVDLQIEAHESASLAEVAVEEVTADNRNEAIRRLKEVSLVAISETEASRLLGHSLTLQPGTAPYLVRGLCCNRVTGHFSASYFRGRLWVEHGSMGSSVGRVEQQPVIVMLATKPQKIFVTLTVIQ